jgi:hypothetical protein
MGADVRPLACPQKPKEPTYKNHKQKNQKKFTKQTSPGITTHHKMLQLLVAK